MDERAGGVCPDDSRWASWTGRNKTRHRETQRASSFTHFNGKKRGGKIGIYFRWNTLDLEIDSWCTYEVLDEWFSFIQSWDIKRWEQS